MTSVAYLSYSGTGYYVALGYDSDSGYATSFVCTDSGQTWTEGTQVTTDGTRWYGLALGSTAGTAYAVGYKTDTGYAAMHKSSLAASLSWTSLTDTLTAIQFNDVATSDGVSIIAVGTDRSSDKAVVFYSTDSGTTWTQSTATSLTSSSLTQFYSVSMFCSAGTCTAFLLANDYVFVTTTYGSSFDYNGAATNADIVSGVPPSIHAISAASATTVYAASTSGYILAGTYVSGTSLTWTTSASSSDIVYYSITMLTTNGVLTGVAGVGANTASGATSNNLYLLFSDPTAKPTAAPTTIPSSAPTPSPTYSSTLWSGTWSVVASPGSSSVGSSRVFRGACWPSTSRVVLVGYSGDAGIIVSSSDLGTTWTGTSYAAGQFGRAFSDIACSSTYAVVIGSRGYIYYSSDAAVTWTAYATRLTYALYSVALGTNNVVYVSAASGYVYKATAGTWTFASCSSTAMTTAATNLYGIATFDGTRVYAVGAGGAIYYSTDTATPTWTAATSSVTVDLYSVSCGSSHSCFAGGNSGTLLRTIDGGVTWTTLTTGLSTSYSLKFHAIKMYDSSVAFVTSSGGEIVSTIDAGTTFTSQTTLASGKTVSCVSLIRSNLVVAADTDGRAYLRLTSSPTGQPTRQPSMQPTGQPSRQPSGQPTRQPTRQPSGAPTGMPSFAKKPSGQPTRQPTVQPSTQPTGQPSAQPFGRPTGQPTMQPSGHPTRPNQWPTPAPSGQPSGQPSRQPTNRPSRPSGQPTRQPSRQPTNQPSSRPTRLPTWAVSIFVTYNVTQSLSLITPFEFFESALAQKIFQTTVASILGSKIRASDIIIDQSYGRPTANPTPLPTAKPSPVPSFLPSAEPTAWPSRVPTPARRRLLAVPEPEPKGSGAWQAGIDETEEEERERERAYYAQRQAEETALGAKSAVHRKLQATTQVRYLVQFTLQNTGFASAAVAYTNTTTKLTTSITSGTFTTKLNSVAATNGYVPLGLATASTQVTVSALTTVLGHTSPWPTLYPTLEPTLDPTRAPTKYYTLTLTYFQYEVVVSVCAIVGLILLLLGSYFFVKWQRSRSRFHAALKNATMSKEDRQRQWGLCRMVQFVARYVFCLFLCFKAKTAEEREAEEIARLKREAKRRKKNEGFCSRCCRWMCCCYCCCKMTRCCFRNVCGCKTWCAVPKHDDEDDGNDDDGDLEQPSGASQGLTGKGALLAALKSAQSPSSMSTKGGLPPQRRWGGTVSINDPNAARQEEETKKSGGGVFGAISSLFGGGSSQANQLDANSGAGSEDPDDWVSMTATIVRKPPKEALLAGADGRASPSMEEESKTGPAAEADEGGRGRFRRNKRGPTMDQADDGAGNVGGRGGLPILTLTDVSRYASKKKNDKDHDAAAVPVLPTPGEGGFVSFRDNLKLLEQRRLQEAKRASKNEGSILGKSGYQVKSSSSASGTNANSSSAFLNDNTLHFLG